MARPYFNPSARTRSRGRGSSGFAHGGDGTPVLDTTVTDAPDVKEIRGVDGDGPDLDEHLAWAWLRVPGIRQVRGRRRGRR